MKVYKFGGGVLKNKEAIQQMSQIVAQETELTVVVSAFSKMTNAFEKLYNEYRESGSSKSIDPIIHFHRDLANQLLIEPQKFLQESLVGIIEKLHKDLVTCRSLKYDAGYDQIVCYGELLSSALISAYWTESGLLHRFVDSRDVIKTDAEFRSARVLWQESAEAISFTGITLVQGFIGGTLDGRSTTLGREGSDFTAAICASILNASEVVIWKDVPGVMTADPAQYDHPVLMERISYLEAVELSYFGAKVIHPNTIKPLQNKAIPLYVRSLYDPGSVGTQISEANTNRVGAPIVIWKTNQVLVSIQPRDFSFIMEEALAQIFALLDKHRIRINLMQHGAVSISLVFDWEQEKLDVFLQDLLSRFKVLYNTGLDLLTIRQYTESAIKELTSERQIYIQQKSRKTTRFVLG